MKRVLAILLMSGLFLIADAQPGPPCCPPPGPAFGPGPGMGMGMNMGPRRKLMRERLMRDAERETIRGRVVSIEPMRRGPGGVKLMVEADSRVVPVMVGRMFPLDQLDEPIERNDRVEIRGARVMRGGQPILIAQRIKLEESGEVLRPHLPKDGPPFMGERLPFAPRPWHKRAV